MLHREKKESGGSEQLRIHTPQNSYSILHSRNHRNSRKQTFINSKFTYFPTFYSDSKKEDSHLFCSKSEKAAEMSTTEIVTEELLKIFILDEGKDENTFTANHLGVFLVFP